MKKILIWAVICLPIMFGSCAQKDVNTSVTIYGTVVDADTQDPIQGVYMTLTPGSQECYSGSDGSYLFEDLNKQQYTVVAAMGGYRTDRKTVNMEESDRREVSFALVKE